MFDVSSCASVSLVLGWAVFLQGADPEPPKPNPFQPVNYVEWMNGSLGKLVSENAYKEYLAVYSALGPFEGNLDAVTKGPWSGQKPFADWLAINRNALENFRAASAKQGCYFPLESSPATGDSRKDGLTLHVILPPFDKHRLVCKALLAEGYQAWKKGEQQPLLTNAMSVLRSGRHFDGNGLLIQRLVGQAVAGAGYQALRNAMQLSPEPDKLAASMLRLLEKGDAPFSSLTRTLLTERINLWDICQRVFVPGSRAGTWSIHEVVWTDLSRDIKGAWDPAAQKAVAEIGFDATLSEVNAYYDALDRWCRTPMARTGDENMKLEHMATRSKNPLLKNALPIMTRTRVLDELHSASRNATRLIAHLLIHQASAGEFPSTLDGLESKELAQLRVDPFSGRDLCYKSDGDRFTLYSVYDNFKDDGGKHASKSQEGDYVFWPAQP